MHGASHTNQHTQNENSMTRIVRIIRIGCYVRMTELIEDFETALRPNKTSVTWFTKGSQTNRLIEDKQQTYFDVNI